MHMNSRTGRQVRFLARGLFLVAVAALGPACYSKSGKTYMVPGGPGGPGTTLLTDGFVWAPGPLATQDPDWTATTDAGTAANITLPSAYYLDFTLSARNPSPGATLHATGTTAAKFASGPLTFTLSFEPGAGGPFSTHDLMSIIIKDSATATIISRADFDDTTGMFTFTTGASMSSTAATVGSFQNVVFKIDASNNSTWSVGAGFTSAAVMVTPPAFMVLQLQSSYPAGTGAAPLFRFASALVTTP